MSDQSQVEFNALLDQERNFSNELEQIAATDPFNGEQYKAVQDELKTVQAKIEAHKARQSEHMERMEVAAAQITNAIESVDVGGNTFPLRALIQNENDYQVVLIHFNRQFVAQAEEYSIQRQRADESHLNQLEAKANEINQLNYQLAQLQQRNADLTNLLNTAEAERDNAKATADDFEQKLKNAAAEIDRLNSHVDDLRQQIAVGASGAIKVIDTEAEAEKLRKWKDGRKIYNKRWKDDITKTTYLANLAATAEEIEIPHYAINSWTVITEDEAARFRAEQAGNNPTNPVEENPIPDPPLVINPPEVTFPSSPEVPNDNNPVEGIPTDGTVETPTVEERIAALEQAVFGQVKGSAA